MSESDKHQHYKEVRFATPNSWNINGGSPINESAKHQILNPTPTAKRYLAIIDIWKQHEGVTNISVPIAIQDEAWDITFYPTEKVELLSRAKKPIGITAHIKRIPSFLK